MPPTLNSEVAPGNFIARNHHARVRLMEAALTAGLREVTYHGDAEGQRLVHVPTWWGALAPLNKAERQEVRVALANALQRRQG